jgi:type IV secretion system protein VirD4
MKLITGYVIGDLAIRFFTSGTDKTATSGFNKDLEHLKGKDGFILGRGKNGIKRLQLSYTASVQNVIVIGPPGQHKTTPFVYVQLLADHFPKNTSIVINDSKGELYRDTANYQRSIGRKVFMFEPLGRKGHYNPLEWCETYSEVRKLAVDILTNGTLAVRLNSGNGGLNSSDVTWINLSTPLLTSALFHFRDLGKPNNTISKAVKFLINSDASVIETTLGNSSNKHAVEQFNIFSMSIGSGDEGGGSGPLTSILTTLATNVTLYLDPKIAEKTSYSDFNYKMLRDERTSLYFKYYPEDATYLSPLMSIIYSQLIEKCKKYDDHSKNNIVWLLDEMQNLGKIENLSQTVNTCREAKFAFMLVVQSVSSLIDIYGRSGTKSIMNAMQTKCILPAYSDVEVLKEFTALNGDQELNIQQDKRSYKTKKNVSTPDEIRRLKKDEVLIISQNLKPIVTKQLRYFDDDEMILNQYLGGLK